MFPELVYPPVVDLADRHGVQEMELLASTSLSHHKLGPFKDAKMLHDAEPSHRQPTFEFAERLAIPPKQHVQQPPSRRIGQRLEYQLHSRNICDHMVTCQS